MIREPIGRLVTIKEACALVGVSRRTIYNWIAAGKVNYVRTAGGACRIYAQTLFHEDLSSMAAGRSSSEAGTRQPVDPQRGAQSLERAGSPERQG